MKTTAMYVRVSTDLQTNGSDSQIKALENYCRLKEITNYKIYHDFAISGAKTSRPQLDQMMLDCKNNLIDCVLVYSFSRLARSTKHLILALETFQSLGINFLSISENLDLSTPMGRTIYQILASISELERELIRERVRNGMRAAKIRGSQIGAKKRFTNKAIFQELRANGKTIREIAKLMNCSPPTVLKMLKDPVSEAALC